MNAPDDTKKIKIMHTVLSLEMGGLEKVVSDTVAGLDKDRYEVEVCCFDTLGHFASSLTLHGVKVNLVVRNQERYDTFFPFRLKKLLHERKTDILHMHSGTFFLGTQAALFAGISKMVYTDHGRHLVEPKILLVMDRFCGFFVKKIIAVSHELEKYLVDVVKLPAAKTSTIINGINTEQFSPGPKYPALLDELKIPPSHRVIGTVGRLAEVKDQVSMIKAFAKVRGEISDVTLLLVGDGPLLSLLQQTAKDLNVAGNVVFAGKRTDTSRLLNLMDVFMLTSLSEGTSISLLEAMASGVTPVVTDVGGNPFIIQHEANGLIVTPGDIAGMADAVISLLKHDELRDKYRLNAIESVRRDYSLKSMVDKYSAVYNELYAC
ncbi:MAG: glycosyltransferase [Desulfuromonadaceae bacterium]|nr:glycosyltransferase [Desulfuromonadaceae bacterium]